jgi:hypothetical protein
LAADAIIWSASTKLPDYQAFWPVVMMAVAVVITPFFAAVIIATRHGSLDGSGGSLQSGA